MSRGSGGQVGEVEYRETDECTGGMEYEGVAGDQRIWLSIDLSSIRRDSGDGSCARLRLPT